LEQRNKCIIAATKNSNAADFAKTWRCFFVGDANGLVVGTQDFGRRIEFMGKSMRENFELQLTNGGKDGVGVSHVGVAQHLHNAFFVKLLEATAELLEL